MTDMSSPVRDFVRGVRFSSLTCGEVTKNKALCELEQHLEHKITHASYPTTFCQIPNI